MSPGTSRAMRVRTTTERAPHPPFHSIFVSFSIYRIPRLRIHITMIASEHVSELLIYHLLPSVLAHLSRGRASRSRSEGTRLDGGSVRSESRRDGASSDAQRAGGNDFGNESSHAQRGTNAYALTGQHAHCKDLNSSSTVCSTSRATRTLSRYHSSPRRSIQQLRQHLSPHTQTCRIRYSPSRCHHGHWPLHQDHRNHCSHCNNRCRCLR